MHHPEMQNARDHLEAGALEPFIFKWKQFDGMGFSRQPGKHRSHDAAHRARILTTLAWKRHPSEAVGMFRRSQR